MGSAPDRRHANRNTIKNGVLEYWMDCKVDETAARDIDLGVLGVPKGHFIDFYTELIKRLPKPVDLVDLSKPTLFNKLILRDGMRIYG